MLKKEENKYFLKLFIPILNFEKKRPVCYICLFCYANSVSLVVLLVDGWSDYDAHVWRETSIVLSLASSSSEHNVKFLTSINKNKCLKEITYFTPRVRIYFLVTIKCTCLITGCTLYSFRLIIMIEIAKRAFFFIKVALNGHF